MEADCKKLGVPIKDREDVDSQRYWRDVLALDELFSCLQADSGAIVA
jgi:hypothetical protein